MSKNMEIFLKLYFWQKNNLKEYLIEFYFS